MDVGAFSGTTAERDGCDDTVVGIGCKDVVKKRFDIGDRSWIFVQIVFLTFSLVCQAFDGVDDRTFAGRSHSIRCL